MKKVIAFAAVLVLAIVLMVQCSFAVVDTFTTGGCALPEGKVIENLKKESIKTNKADISGIAVNANDTLFLKGNDLFVGEKNKEKIDSILPFFMKDGSAVRIFNDQSKLVDTNFAEEETYEGMILSGGVAYNQEGQRSDWNEYYFLKISTPVYINQNNIKIKTTINSYNIPKNSICFFGEEVVRYYTLDGQKFKYNNLGDVDKVSVVTMGSESLTYYQLQEKLGLVSNEKNLADNNAISQQKEQKTNYINNGGTTSNGINYINNQENKKEEGADKEKNDEQGQITKPSDPSKPSIPAVPSEPGKPLEPTPPEIPVIPPGQGGSGEIGGGSGTPLPPEGALPPADADAAKPLPPSDGGNGGAGDGGNDPDFVMPTVKQGAMTPGVYSLLSKLEITDPASVMVGVTYEIRKDGKLIKKAAFAQSGENRITGLDGETTYTIAGSFKYKKGKEFKTENFYAITTFNTKNVEEQIPLKVEFKNGNVYGNAIELADFGFQTDCDEDALSGVSKIEIKSSTQGRESVFKIPSATINKMKKGDKEKVKTADNLESNNEYNFELVFYDKKDNVMKVQGEPKGKAKTCKEMPKGNITVKSVAGISELKLTINNKDQVELTGITLKVVERASGNVVVHQPIADGETVKMEDLGFNKAYIASVYATCDIEDGNGLQETLMGESKFVTAGYDSLGAIYLANTYQDITSESTNLKLLVTSKTNSNLMMLVDKLKIVVKGKEGNIEVALTEEQLNQLKNNEEITVAIEGLQGSQKYTVSAQALAFSGVDSFNPKVYLTETFFTTLKEPAQVIIKNVFTLNAHIEFDLQIIDTQHTIGGSTVAIRIYEKESDKLVYSGDAPVNSEDPQAIVLDKDSHPIEVGKTYTVNIFASQYNDNSGAKDNYQLASFDIATKENMTGRVYLGALEAGTDDNQLNAKIKVEINDPNGDTVGEGRKVYLLIEKEGKETERIDFTYKGKEFSTVIERLLEKEKDPKKPYNIKLYLPVSNNGRDYQVLLDYFTLVPDKAVYVITNEQEFMNAIKLGKNASGNSFLVVNNLQIDSAYIGDFYGQMNFQGFTLSHTSGKPLISQLKAGASITNLVYKETVKSEGEYSAHLVDTNRGTIDNIYVNFDTQVPENESVKTQNVSTVSRNNYGTITNFVVEIQSHINMWSQSGGICRTNSGTVKNGYLFGHNSQNKAKIFVRKNYENVNGNVGGLVGTNNGTLENAFILSDMVNSGAVDSCRKMGLIVGENNGKIRNVYSWGDSTKPYYPNMDTNYFQHKPVKDVYYISEKIYNDGDTNWNKKISIASVNDSQWQSNMLNSNGNNSFEVDEMVAMGMFPQLKLDNYTPKQQYIALPKLAQTTQVKITSSKVTEIVDENTQIATVKLYNPGQYIINHIRVNDIESSIMEGSQKDEGKYTTVNIKLFNPRRYLSKYTAADIGYSIAKGEPVNVEACDGETIKAEFFKPIGTVDEWKQIAERPDENFIIRSDLDFNGSASNLDITFSGKIHGNNHVLKNIVQGADSNGYIINKVSGYEAEIKDIEFQNVKFNTNSSHLKNASTFLYLDGGATLDGITIKNCDYRNRYAMGGLAMEANNATVKNCVIANSTINLSNSGNANGIGGLFGVAYGVEVTNCLVSGSNISASNGKAGGLIGKITGGSNSIRDSYVQGGVISFSTQDKVGGIVGSAENCTLELKGIYSKIELSTSQTRTSGIAGIANISNGVIVDDCINAISLESIGGYSGLTRYRTTNLYRSIGGYYISNQTIGGKENPDGDGENLALTVDDLMLQSTYTDIVGFGQDSWDFSQLESGILPKLRSTYGNILPYQGETSIGKDINQGEVTCEKDGDKYNITINLVHKQEITISSVVIDGMKIVSSKMESTEKGTTIKLGATVDKAWDQYFVKQINYKIGNKSYVQKSGPLLPIEQQWKDLASVDDWNKISNDTENYRLVKTINFNFKNPNTEKNIGRLVGETEEASVKDPITGENVMVERPKYSLKNYKALNHLTFIGSCKEFSGIDMDNYSNVSRYGSYQIDLMENCTFTNGTYAYPFADNIGTVNNISIYGVKGQRSILGNSITKLNNLMLENTNLSSEQGDIGTVVKTCGSMNNIRGKNIVMGTKNRKGGLAFQCSGNISNIALENISTTREGEAGGICWKVGGNIENIYIKGIDFSKSNGNMGAIASSKSSGSPTYMNITVEGTDGGRTIGNGSGRAGGLVGWSDGGTTTAENITIKNIKIDTSLQSGGVIGTNNTNNGYLKAINVTVEDCDISSNYVVGGILGLGNISVENVVVKDTRIEATDDPAAGIVGTGGVTPKNVEVIGCTIISSYSAGGIVGNSGGGCGNPGNKNPYVSGIVKDSTITGKSYASGIAGWNCTAAGGWIVDNCDITGNSRASGISCYHFPSNQIFISKCYVVNSRITGGSDGTGGIISMIQNTAPEVGNCIVKNSTIKGTNNVGGIIGICNAGARNCAVIDSKVEASEENAGGIVGSLYNRGGKNIKNCYSNAVVSGTSKIGGIVGCYNCLNKGASTGNCYFTGSITGTSSAGGMVGACLDFHEKYDNSGAIFAGTIDSQASPSSAFTGSANEIEFAQYKKTSNGYKVWNSSKINGNTVNLTDLGNGGSANPPWIFMISTEDMLTGANKELTDPFYGYNEGTFDFTQCEDGFMPLLKDTNGEALFPKTESGYGSLYYQGGVTIPTVLNSQKQMLIKEKEEIHFPKAEAYSTSASKLNIEFSSVSENITVEIKDSEGNVVLDEPLKNRIVTLDYDFMTALTITLYQGEAKTSQIIEAAQVVRKAETCDDNYYYITASGISDKTGPVIEGEFVNLYKGSAMDKTGNIYSLSTRSVTGKNNKIGLSDVQESLFTFDHEGYTLKTYGSFTESINQTTQETVVNDQLRMVVKNGQVYGISNSISPSKDGFIYYEKDGDKYEAILLTNGRIKDFGANKGEGYVPIKLPEQFRNSGIHQLTNNILSSGTIAVAVYDDGSVVAFDFITGKIEAQERATVAEESLMSFVKELLNVFGNDEESTSADADSFEENTKLIEALETTPISVAEQTITEESDDQFSSNVKIPNSSVTISGQNGKAGEEDYSEEIALTKSEATERYVLVYVDKDKKYQIFKESQLLSKNSSQVKSQNEIIAENAELVDFYKMSQPAQDKSNNNKANGIMLYLVISVMIIGLLSLVVLKKRND